MLFYFIYQSLKPLEYVVGGCHAAASGYLDIHGRRGLVRVLSGLRLLEGHRDSDTLSDEALRPRGSARMYKRL